MTEATDYLRPAQVGEIMGWSRSERAGQRSVERRTLRGNRQVFG